MTLPRTPATLSILALGFGLTVGLGACVDDGADSGLTVLRAATPDSGCTFSAESTAFQASGVIQSNSRDGYLLAPVVRNDLTLLEGEAITPKTVFVTGAEVTIKFYDTDLFTAAEQATMTDDGLIRFLAPFAGSIEPNAGVGVFPFDAVPAELIAMIHDRLGEATLANTLLDVQVKVVGTRGGSELHSNLFRFPVEVCQDCVVRFLGECRAIPAGTIVGTGGVCQPLQDGHLDCCYGADPDLTEMTCMPGMDPDEGHTCDNGVDDPIPTVCPAVPVEL